MTEGDRDEGVVTNRPGTRLLLVAAVALGAVGVFILLADASAHFVAANSDGATIVLEGQVDAGGRIAAARRVGRCRSTLSSLRRGAVLRRPSHFFGLRHDLVNVVPAAIATFVVVVSVILATRSGEGGQPHAAGAVVLGLLACPARHSHSSSCRVRGMWERRCSAWSHSRRHPMGSSVGGLPIATVVLAACLLGDAQTVKLGDRSRHCWRRCRSWAGTIDAQSGSVRQIAIGSALAGSCGARALQSSRHLHACRRESDSSPLVRSWIQPAPPSRVRFAGLFGVGTVPIGPANTPSRIVCRPRDRTRGRDRRCRRRGLLPCPRRRARWTIGRRFGPVAAHSTICSSSG